MRTSREVSLGRELRCRVSVKDIHVDCSSGWDNAFWPLPYTLNWNVAIYAWLSMASPPEDNNVIIYSETGQASLDINPTTTRLDATKGQT